MILPDMSKIKINKSDERGYYICDKNGNYYLHKDGKFKLGINRHSEQDGFWEKKEEAEEFFNNWSLSLIK